MRIAFTFRNIEPSEAIKQYAREKVAKLQKYMRAPLDVELTLSTERHLHYVDIRLAADGELLLGREESEDMYASIDRVMDKVRTQLRRSKSAVADNRRRSQESLKAIGERAK